MKDSKYLIFNLLAKNEKTNIYEVISKLHDTHLGFIRWYGAWRCYAFFSDAETIWNKDCLHDIELFIENLMHDRLVEKIEDNLIKNS